MHAPNPLLVQSWCLSEELTFDPIPISKNTVPATKLFIRNEVKQCDLKSREARRGVMSLASP